MEYEFLSFLLILQCHIKLKIIPTENVICLIIFALTNMFAIVVVTARQRCCGKVMFSVARSCHSVYEGAPMWPQCQNEGELIKWKNKLNVDYS